MTAAPAFTLVLACFAPILANAFIDSESLLQNKVDVNHGGDEPASAPFRQTVSVPLATQVEKASMSSSRRITANNNSGLLSLMLNAAVKVAKSNHLAGSFGAEDTESATLDQSSDQEKTISLAMKESFFTLDPRPYDSEHYLPLDAEKHVMDFRSDVFPNRLNRRSATPEDNGWKFFNSAPGFDWLILGIAIVVLILFDWFVLRRFPDTFAWHIGIVFTWLALAAVYNLIVFGRMGSKSAFDWFTGYLLEWMLSMDNLFVFHLVFTVYQTPAKQIHKAVFIGIIGAVVMRMLFFMVVSTLLKLFGWFRWPFGALLVWSGIEAARGEDDDDDEDGIKDTRLIRALRFCLGSRLSEEYDHEEERCFIQGEDGRTKATILLVVICCLEFTDILFALDSVSAKVAQIPDQYLAFSSSVIAMFGLRAMFFIIKDLVEMFDLLKYGLCLILIFIGCELMFARWIKLSSATVCIMIVGVFVICIIASRARQAMIDARELKSSLLSSKIEETSEIKMERQSTGKQPEDEPEGDVTASK